jgi:hypothetical protein
MGTRHSPRPVRGGNFMHDPGVSRRGNAEVSLNVIAWTNAQRLRKGAEATKQSIFDARCAMDCFAEPAIGRAFARPGGPQ